MWPLVFCADNLLTAGILAKFKKMVLAYVEERKLSEFLAFIINIT